MSLVRPPREFKILKLSTNTTLSVQIARSVRRPDPVVYFCFFTQALANDALDKIKTAIRTAGSHPLPLAGYFISDQALRDAIVDLTAVTTQPFGDEFSFALTKDQFSILEMHDAIHNLLPNVSASALPTRATPSQRPVPVIGHTRTAVKIILDEKTSIETKAAESIGVDHKIYLCFDSKESANNALVLVRDALQSGLAINLAPADTDKFILEGIEKMSVACRTQGEFSFWLTAEQYTLLQKISKANERQIAVSQLRTPAEKHAELMKQVEEFYASLEHAKIRLSEESAIKNRLAMDIGKKVEVSRKILSEAKLPGSSHSSVLVNQTLVQHEAFNQDYTRICKSKKSLDEINSSTTVLIHAIESFTTKAQKLPGKFRCKLSSKFFNKKVIKYTGQLQELQAQAKGLFESVTDLLKGPSSVELETFSHPTSSLSIPAEETKRTVAALPSPISHGSSSQVFAALTTPTRSSSFSFNLSPAVPTQSPTLSNKEDEAAPLLGGHAAPNYSLLAKKAKPVESKATPKPSTRVLSKI